MGEEEAVVGGCRARPLFPTKVEAQEVNSHTLTLSLLPKDLLPQIYIVTSLIYLVNCLLQGMGFLSLFLKYFSQRKLLI